MKVEAEKEGIYILGFSSDGDTKFLKAMEVMASNELMVDEE